MKRQFNKVVAGMIGLTSGRLRILVFIVLLAQLSTVHAQEVMRFAVIGDYGSGDSNQESVANLVKGWNPDFIITTGDNNYPDGEAATIDRNIGKYYHMFIHPYRGTYGPGATTNRFFPSMGNHDWDNRTDPPGQPYVDYFTLPGNERYYDFVWGPIHFFAINSDIREPDGNTADSVQGNWLRNRLAASTAQWKVVYLHHPPYSSRTSWPKLQWPFREWGANVVLSGHAHVYERIMREGVAFITNGLGGDSTGGFSGAIDGSVCRFGTEFGAMLVKVSSTSVTFQFITRAGVIIDTYTMGPEAVVPNAPLNLTATTVSSSQINLSWTDNSINEDGFRIEQSTNGAAFVEVGSVSANETSFPVTNLSSGSSYSFRVRAVNNAGYSAYSNTAGSGGSTTPPAAPSNLSAAAASSSQINLTWADNSSDESGFKVERCEGVACTNFSQIAQTSTNATSFQDTGRTANTTYNYRVRAFNSAGNSSYSNTAGATTLPTTTGPSEPPSNLTAAAVSLSRINLNWTDDSNNEEGFKIERCTGPSCTSFVEITRVGANVESYSDTGLQSYTTYRYRVRAYANGIDSAYSNTAEATTDVPDTSVFSDDFNDGVRDPSKWSLGILSRSPSNYDSQVQAVETNGYLQLTPRSNVSGNSYGGYVSASTWDLNGSNASVEVVRTASQGAVTIFSVGNDRNNWYGFRAKGSTLFLEARIGGTTSSVSIKFQDGQLYYWRLRHDQSTDSILFETSTNGSTWKVVRTVPRQISISSVKVELVVGTSKAISAPGFALFDNFRLGANGLTKE